MKDYNKCEHLPRDIKASTYTDAYNRLVGLVHYNGSLVSDERGDWTRKLFGITVRIKPTDKLDHPITELFNAPSPALAMKFAKGIIDDAEAAKIGDEFDYGYGERLRRANGVNIIRRTLRTFPYSRRMCLPVFDSSDVVAAAYDLREVPCCTEITFNVHDKQLNMKVDFRSNDILMAFPADIFGYAALQHKLANETGIPVGEIMYCISDAHYRMSDVDYAVQLNKTVAKPKFYKWTDI